MRSILVLTIFCFFSVKAYSQDTNVGKQRKQKHLSPLDIPDYQKQRLSFSINAFQLLINEVGANIDYCYNYRHSFGINVSYVYKNRFWADFFTSDEAGSNPFTIYEGTAYRINYKYYFTHQRRLYFSPQLVYKMLSYNSALQYAEHDSHDYFDVYRAEKAIVYGLDLICGYHIKTLQSKLNMEAFAGLTLRYKIRDYTTFGTYVQNSNFEITDSSHPKGTFHEESVYPMIVVGFKFGINTFFK